MMQKLERTRVAGVRRIQQKGWGDHRDQRVRGTGFLLKPPRARVPCPVFQLLLIPLRQEELQVSPSVTS